MKKAFVTGATGFVGSHLVEALLRRGYGEVRCLVRTSLKWLEGLDVTVVRGNLASEDLVREAVSDVDYIFHVGGVTRAMDWTTFRKNNVEATVRLLEVTRAANPSVRRVLVTSSLAAVGACDGGVATESSPLNPVSRYGRSKAEMELALSAFRNDLSLTVVRPPAVYGPREADIYTFFKTLKYGICPVVGTGSTPALSLIYAEDLVSGMIDAAESGTAVGETYFLGSEVFYSWNEVKHAASRALGRRAVTIPVPAPLVEGVGALVEGIGRIAGFYPPLNREKAREIRHVCKMCSVDKAQRDFGFRQHVSLEDGVRRTIEWYRQEGWL